MGKEYEEWIYVYVQLIHFAIYQKLNTTLYFNYTPIKQTKKGMEKIFSKMPLIIWREQKEIRPPVRWWVYD